MAAVALFTCKAEGSSSAARCAIQEAEERTWSDQEKWVWGCVCTGKIADFDQREGRQINSEIYPAGKTDRNICRALHPDSLIQAERGLNATAEADKFPEHRIITPAFVETMLFREPYRTAVPNPGVRIRGAWFKAPLQLANGQLVGSLSIENSRFEQSIDMTSARSPGTISFNYSDIRGELDAELLSVARLELMFAVLWKKVDVLGSRITGSLVMHGIHIKCDFWADSIVVDGHIYLRAGSKFERIARIRNAKIGFNLYLDRAQFFRLDLSGTKIQGEINAGYDDKKNQVEWRDRSPKEPAILVLRNASAGALLGLPDGWPALSLEGFSYGYIKIDELGSETMGEWGKRWLKKSLPVSGTEITPDRCESSPYLWRQPKQGVPFQPYRQYAETIAKAGMIDEANSVLFAGRELEREYSTGWKYWTMTFSSYLVGYGYGWRYFFALGWAALLVGIGYALIVLTGENEKQARAYERLRHAESGATGLSAESGGGPRVVPKRDPMNETGRLDWVVVLPAVLYRLLNSVRENEGQSWGKQEARAVDRPLYLGLLFCVDMLIPLIQFNRKHYEVTLHSRIVRTYFVAHRVFGFVLGSFIVAGLTGLTK